MVLFLKSQYSSSKRLQIQCVHKHAQNELKKIFEIRQRIHFPVIGTRQFPWEKDNRRKNIKPYVKRLLKGANINTKIGILQLIVNSSQ